MHVSKKVVLLVLAICTAFSLSGCGGSSKPLSISITSTSATVDGTDSVTLTATVTSDKNGAGVSWAVTSGGGTLSNQTATSATYTAPAATSSQQTITITATSVAKSTQTQTLTLTVPAKPTFPSSITSASLTGAVGTAYSVTLQGSGGIPPYKNWALASNSNPLPPCLQLSSAGVLTTKTGTAPPASCAGTYDPIFTFQDSGTPTPLTGTSPDLTITITAAPAIMFTPTLPAGAVGTAYAGGVTASGGAGTLTYALVGTLPPDLSFSTSTGAITGTPKAADAGTTTFAITASDAYGDTATSGNLSITITAPTISFPASLSAGAVGTAYTGSVAASGPVGATTYTLASGSLPADLSLNASTGAITGTPKATDVGTATFTVKVVDAFGDTATSGSLSITIAAAPAITFGTAPTATATVGVAYSSTLTASGGAGALTYSISSGSLPTGLSLNASSGAITGSPTVVGPVTFTAKAQDNFGDTPVTQSYTITVSPGAATHFAVALTSSSTITAGSAVSFTVTALDTGGNTATGYSGTVAFTSTDAQATLPAASTLASGIGSFSATLKTAGSQTVTATDSGNATISGTSVSITVNPGSAASLVVVAPATATINVPFNFTVTAKDQYNNTATGFTDIVHFTSTDGSAVLPPNTGLNGATGGIGTFSATLATPGSQTITATDALNASIKGTSGTITASNTVTITTSSIGPFDSGQTVSQTLNATGGSGNSANYSWSWVAGGGSSIPPGLSLSTAGVITGTAGTAGSYTVSITVKDTGVSPNQTFTQTFTIVINGALTLPAPNPASLPGGYTGVLYNGSVSASGGSGTYCYSVTSGLPSDGLSAPANNSLCGYVAPSFLVSGTPTAAGTVTFGLKVTDGTGASVVKVYTITITNPTPVTLPAANPSSLPSATVNQAYNGAIDASGGVPPYTWSINGTAVSSGGISVGNGLTASATGGSSLSITGSPTATGTVTLTNVKVTDSLNTNATQSYTITVNNTQNVSGQITADNYNFCGSTTLPPLPAFTVTLKDSGGNVVQTVSSSSNGQYSFSGVTAGTYTIVPSYAGPTGSTSMFYPASQSVTVSTSTISNQNFNISLGYQVTGTVNYTGTNHGLIYVDLVSNCGNNGNATSISSAGTFTIHGVAPGQYRFQVWMDPSTLNEGSPNEADPTGSLTGVTVSNANLTGQTITLTDPTPTTPTATPKIKGISPADQGVVISYGRGSVTDNNGLEIYSSYTVQWSTTPTGFSSSNQATFKAAGTNANVLILRTGNVNVTGSLSNGTPYYFKFWGTNAGGAGPAVTSTTTVTPNPPASGSGLNQVTGTINIPSTVTINSGAPLYLGLYDQNTNTAYAAVIANPSNSVGNNFTVYVPSSPGNVPNYILFGILDQNKDGVIDTGDVTNVNQSGGSPIAITGAASEPAVTLPAGNANAVVQAQYVSVTSSGSSNPTTSYSLNFNIRQGVKLPVAVTLTGGPSIMNPVDFSNYCQGCGSVQFQDYFNINSDTPSVGQSYTFTVKYSDGSSDTQTATVTGWNGGSSIVGASNLVTNMLPSGSTGPSAGTRTTPTFSWGYPSSVNSTDVFSFGLYNTSNNSNIWYIPGNNSNLNGLPTSLTSISWGVDPSDSTNVPSVSSLTTGTTYDWYISVTDSNGNQAWNWMYYVP